jgi:hypothetical protein
MDAVARAQLAEIIEWHATRNEMHPHIGAHQTLMLLEYLAGEKAGFEATVLRRPDTFINGQPPLVPLFDRLEFDYYVSVYYPQHKPEYKKQFVVDDSHNRYRLVSGSPTEVQIHYVVGEPNRLTELREHGGFEHAPKDLIADFLGFPNEQRMTVNEMGRETHEKRQALFNWLEERGAITERDQARANVLLSYSPKPTEPCCLSYISHAKHMEERLLALAEDHGFESLKQFLYREYTGYETSSQPSAYALNDDQMDIHTYLIDNYDGDDGQWTTDDNGNPICPCGTPIDPYGRCSEGHISPLVQVGLPRRQKD